MASDVKLINNHPFIKYSHVQYGHEEMIQRSTDFYDWLESRRSVRDFSDRPVPKAVIENIIMSASTAPSGAHKLCNK
jgi:iodotyrosine deiodinase